jgi:hypothetical protein
VILERHFFHNVAKEAQRKKKEAKKIEGEALWKLPQPWKSEAVAFGIFFLDEFCQA